MNTKKSLDDIFTFKVGVTSEGGKSNIEVSSINTLFLGLNIQYILEDRNPKSVYVNICNMYSYPSLWISSRLHSEHITLWFENKPKHPIFGQEYQIFLTQSNYIFPLIEFLHTVFNVLSKSASFFDK